MYSDIQKKYKKDVYSLLPELHSQHQVDMHELLFLKIIFPGFT